LPPPQRFPVGIDATGEEQQLPDRPRRQRVDRFGRSHQPQEGPHYPDRLHGLSAWSPLGNRPAAHELLGQPRDAVLAQAGKDAENRLRDERLQKAAHDAPLVSRPPFVADAVEGPVDLPTEKDRGAGAGTASGTSGTSRMRHVPAVLMPVDTPTPCCVVHWVIPASGGCVGGRAAVATITCPGRIGVCSDARRGTSHDWKLIRLLVCEE